jgi:cardiolipin synthase (CMP-forming)
VLAEKTMRTRILTVPNQLTFLRLIFLPFFVIAIKYSNWKAAIAILAAAAVSDGLDGLLARGLNQRTPLGAYLDPIADKLLLSSSYFVLALKGRVPWWLTILVLSRDVLLLTACAVILITVGYRPFPPSLWGKATTFFEIFLIVVVLVAAVWNDRALGDLRFVLAYIVGAFVLLSGIHYSITVSRQLHAGQ